jgi:hypothetical protein
VEERVCMGALGGNLKSHTRSAINELLKSLSMGLKHCIDMNNGVCVLWGVDSRYGEL